MNFSKLAEDITRGDRKAAARLISLVEDEEEGYVDAMKLLYERARGVPVLGITGPPGVGKSTIVLEIAKRMRAQGMKLGIVAVDPTSPITGGAILGDRIRMTELFADRDIFIRSMGSRGGSGGLSSQAGSVVRILDALGCDAVIVETVGAGQTQVDIMGMADTIVVVTMPSTGDEVQSIKAGLLEIADVYVVNKCDLTGAMRTLSDISSMLDLVEDWHGWKPPVLQTNAREGKGIDELLGSIQKHEAFASGSEHLASRKKAQLRRELQELVSNEVTRRIFENIGTEELDEILNQMLDRSSSPYSEAERITADVVRKKRATAR